MDGNVNSNRKHILRQCFVTANVDMTLVGSGCAVGISAVLIPSLRTPESHIHATLHQESWIAASLALTLIAGTFLITAIVDKLGRSKCHFIIVLTTLVGWFILLLADGVEGLIAARLLQGVALGMNGFLGSIIIAEMTHPKHRGMFLSTYSLAVTIGVLFTHALGTFLSWQYNALICSMITFTSLVMLFYTPESPSWLISKGRYEEAREIFVWLRGKGEEQDTEFEKMVVAQKMLGQSNGTGQNMSLILKSKRYFRYLNETCRKPEFYKPITIMILSYTSLQFAGIHVISSYAIDIIKQLVGPEANSKTIMVALDIERLLGNLLTVYLMKTMKRRTLLFTTGFAFILSYYGKAVYIYLKQNDKLPFDSQWIPISLIALYMFTLTVGISSVPFALAGEVFPLEYRGLGSGISAFGLSVNFFIAVKCFPVLIHSIGMSLTYTLYATIVTVCLCVVWFLLPETKDRTLQDIEDHFRGYSPGDAKSSKPLKGTNEEK